MFQFLANKKSAKARKSGSRRAASCGVTLIELAASTIIFGVLSVAVASLMTAGVHNQMAIRAHEYEQTVALNIVDRLRLDLMSAENINATNGNQALTFTSYTFTPLGEAVTWNLAGGVATRNGVAFHNSPSPNIVLDISCGGFGETCFDLNFNPTNGLVNSVTLNELVVSHILPRGCANPDNPQNDICGTGIDQQFGGAQYRINEFSFDVLTGYQFQ